MSFVAWPGLLILGVHITNERRSLYIGPFCPTMTSLSRYLEEAAFSRISSSVFIFLWSFSTCIMDMVSSIVFIPRPSLSQEIEETSTP